MRASWWVTFWRVLMGFDGFYHHPGTSVFRKVHYLHYAEYTNTHRHAPKTVAAINQATAALFDECLDQSQSKDLNWTCVGDAWNWLTDDVKNWPSKMRAHSTRYSSTRDGPKLHAPPFCTKLYALPCYWMIDWMIDVRCLQLFPPFFWKTILLVEFNFLSYWGLALRTWVG